MSLHDETTQKIIENTLKKIHGISLSPTGNTPREITFKVAPDCFPTILTRVPLALQIESRKRGFECRKPESEEGTVLVLNRKGYIIVLGISITEIEKSNIEGTIFIEEIKKNRKKKENSEQYKSKHIHQAAV